MILLVNNNIKNFTMPNYGNPRYWDRRYQENEGQMYDWLEGYASLKHLFQNKIDRNSRILILGCGNSKLGEEIYDDGFQNIYNIDISSTVIS